nr:MAG TPA: hypothetical protein [Bacteriophage sp.]DAH37746.1 MAG TPA: hypothetical protein [Caudoviricetes sp.]
MTIRGYLKLLKIEMLNHSQLLTSNLIMQENR